MKAPFIIYFIIAEKGIPTDAVIFCFPVILTKTITQNQEKNQKGK
jgi:hypothetical protein